MEAGGLKTSDWLKGGVRYLKLKRKVPEYLAPEPVSAFFVAVRSHGGSFRLVSPLTPLQREFVVALTERKLVVLRLKRPGVFRASIAGASFECARSDATASWKGDQLVIAGKPYVAIAFHREDAEQLSASLSG